jgi:hypothetical protein
MWFAIVRAKIDRGCSPAMATVLMALAVDSGVVLFTLTPEAVLVAIATEDEQSARMLGGRIASVAKACGSLEVKSVATNDRDRLSAVMGVAGG